VKLACCSLGDLNAKKTHLDMFFCTIDVVKEKLFTQKYKFCFILSNLGDLGQQLRFRDCPGFFWTSGHTRSASLIIRRTGIKL